MSNIKAVALRQLLRPQHLKDMLLPLRGNQDNHLLSALVDFCHLVLRGDTPAEIRPFFFGAYLIALRKKSGDVWPITVGCTMRRLVAKVASNLVVSDMGDSLSPLQLGYGVQGGSEAAVHAACCFINNMDLSQAMVKLDYANTFNSLRRDRMLEAVSLYCPVIYPFVLSAYAATSNLQWGDHSLSSAEGVQQGDPLGPLLFCLTLRQHSLKLRSVLRILYLDSVTLGGDCSDLLRDLSVMKDASDLGFTLNSSKCEIISHDRTACDTLQHTLPGAQLIPPSQV